MDLKQFTLSAMELQNALQERPCQRCGACCRSFSVEIQTDDMLLEPRLLQHATAWEHIPIHRRYSFSPAPWVILTNGEPCPFLNKEFLCSIYSTRPVVCRKITPSIITCHFARLEERGFSIARFLKEALVEYDLDYRTASGLILAIDPAKHKPIGIARGYDPRSLTLTDLVDREYLQKKRNAILRSELLS